MFSCAALPPLKTNLPPLKTIRPSLRQLPRLDPLGLDRGSESLIWDHGMEHLKLNSGPLLEKINQTPPEAIAKFGEIKAPRPLGAPEKSEPEPLNEPLQLHPDLDHLSLPHETPPTKTSFPAESAELYGENVEAKDKPLKPFINLKLDELLQAPPIDLDAILKSNSGTQKEIKEIQGPYLHDNQELDHAPNDESRGHESRDESAEQAEQYRRRAHRTFGFESQGRRSCRPPPAIKISVLALPTTVPGFRHALRNQRKQRKTTTKAHIDGRITATMSLSYCTFDDDLLATLPQN